MQRLSLAPHATGAGPRLRRAACGLALALACAFTASGARAGDDDLADDAPKADPGAPKTEGFGAPPPKVTVTIRGRTYSLLECLALADRNHPNLWSMRAKLAFVHAQLDEAKWTPFSQFSAQGGGGVLSPVGGTAYYNNTPRLDRLSQLSGAVAPAFQISFNGTIPVYTFGKIDAVRRAAEANIRVTEWDAERVRTQVRSDVRKAYFGLQLARDAQYLIDEVQEKLDKYIDTLRKKLDKGDKSVDEVDRIRMENYRDEVVLRRAQANKGEVFAISALRFFTGVQTNFEVPDEPLKRPDVTVGPVVQYLSAARLLRPEVNMARAGVDARKAMVDYQRARLFPDFGINLSANYNVAPSAVRQTAAWIGDGYNGFGYGFAFGFRWNLDLLPQSARIGQAEAQLEETRSQLRYALGGLAVEVENQYGTVIEAKTREESWARIEHRAKGWLSLTQDRIDLGTNDERAIIEPTQAYLNARAQHTLALMDLNVALAELARVSGWDAASPTGK